MKWFVFKARYRDRWIAFCLGGPITGHPTAQAAWAHVQEQLGRARG